MPDEDGTVETTEGRITRRLREEDCTGKSRAQPGAWDGLTVDQRAMVARVMAEELERVRAEIGAVGRIAKAARLGPQRY